MDVAASMEAAQAQTGLDDYGPEADAMVEALTVLVRSANDEADLSEQGEMVFGGMVVSLLTRRLEIEHWYAEHPEIDDQEIASVLFGVGLPRTGSTALSYLLAQDHAVRSLRMWEATQPTPPPELEGEDHDPRFLAAQEAMGSLQLGAAGAEVDAAVVGRRPVGVPRPAEPVVPVRDARHRRPDAVVRRVADGLRLRTCVPVPPSAC